MNDQEIVDVVQAHIDGKDIEQAKWGIKNEPFDGTWKFDTYYYRVKPKSMKGIMN